MDSLANGQRGNSWSAQNVPYHRQDENLADMQVSKQFKVDDVMMSDHATLPASLNLVEATVAAEIVASDSPRKAGFNYGVGWGTNPKPGIYFDGVKLHQALADIAHEAQSRAWRVETALRNVRLAETPAEKTVAVDTLTETVRNIHHTAHADLELIMSVNELADTIDEIAPPNPRGYVPHMGIHYAVAPLRKLIRKIRMAFVLSDS